METKASVFGHPLHAMLIPVPIGAFSVALVFDALYAWTLDDTWYVGGALTAGVGALALLGAIVPGLVDYFASVPREGLVRKRATVHMTLGLALTGYWIASAVMRWLTLPDPGRTVAWSNLAFTAVGVLGLMAQGALGGALAHRHRVGVRED